MYLKQPSTPIPKIEKAQKNLQQATNHSIKSVIQAYVGVSQKIGFIKALILFGWIGSWIVWGMYYAVMRACSESHHPWLSWTSFVDILYQKDPCGSAVWWPVVILTLDILFPLLWCLLYYAKTRKDWLIQELTGETPEDKNTTPESGNIVRGRFSQKSGKKISRASFMRKFVFFYSLFTFLPVAIGIQMIHDHLYFASGWFWYGMFFLFCAFCSLVLGPVFSPWPDLSQYKTEQETTQDVGRYIRN